MTASPHILIAGAGLGGIVAALAMLQGGLRVSLFEQATELQEVGAGVQIGSNGSQVLVALGLQKPMEDIASVPSGKQVRLYSTGQAWPVVDLTAQATERYGAPYWMVHRGDFHRVLLTALRERAPDALHLSARCIGFEQTETGVRLHLEDGRQAEGDALIGADGVHSQIRRILFGDGPAHFTGIVAWRGVVPMARLPTHMHAPFGNNWIGPHGHVVTYPLRRGEVLNFVGAIERDDWIEESWTQRGSVEECRRDLHTWHKDVHTIIDNVDTPYKWALLGRDPLPRWSIGRVSLLGDACHPTLPFLAQGANMAIEDGMVLARCLAAVPDIPAALARYEDLRRDRTARIVRGAADNVHRFHNPILADKDAAVPFLDREFSAQSTRERYEWVYAYNANTVPI